MILTITNPDFPISAPMDSVTERINSVYVMAKQALGVRAAVRTDKGDQDGKPT
jgi:hypothetical protein